MCLPAQHSARVQTSLTSLGEWQWRIQRHEPPLAWLSFVSLSAGNDCDHWKTRYQGSKEHRPEYRQGCMLRHASPFAKTKAVPAFLPSMPASRNVLRQDCQIESLLASCSLTHSLALTTLTLLPTHTLVTNPRSFTPSHVRTHSPGSYPQPDPQPNPDRDRTSATNS